MYPNCPNSPQIWLKIDLYSSTAPKACGPWCGAQGTGWHYKIIYRKRWPIKNPKSNGQSILVMLILWYVWKWCNMIFPKCWSDGQLELDGYPNLNRGPTKIRKNWPNLYSQNSASMYTCSSILNCLVQKVSRTKRYLKQLWNHYWNFQN